jgi:hypothetical protein
MNILYIGLFLIFALVLLLGAIAFIFIMKEIGQPRQSKSKRKKPPEERPEKPDQAPDEESRLQSFDEWMRERDESDKD